MSEYIDRGPTLNHTKKLAKEVIVGTLYLASIIAFGGTARASYDAEQIGFASPRPQSVLLPIPYNPINFEYDLRILDQARAVTLTSSFLLLGLSALMTASSLKKST